MSTPPVPVLPYQSTSTTATTTTTASRRLSPLNPASSPPYSSLPLTSDDDSRTSTRDSGSSGASANESTPYLGTRTRTTSNQSELDDTAFAIQHGLIGIQLGPFPPIPPHAKRASLALSSPSLGSGSESATLSPTSSRDSVQPFAPRQLYPTQSRYSTISTTSSKFENPYFPPIAAVPSGEVDESLLWDDGNKEMDDYLHNPDPAVDKLLDRQWAWNSLRGWVDGGFFLIIIAAVVGVFAGWPIYRFGVAGGFPNGVNKNLGWGAGGINSTGQVPVTGLPGLIDVDTPQSAYKRTGFDGEEYNLVFSDEFNVDGRTFWPGDDPWWQAVDLNYWQTTDLEWYDPDAIITKDGKMVITLSEQPIHNLAFRSGMVQSWIWTMGNLGRAGYGGTNDGMWPYSYDSCDVGTLPNQTFPNGTTPAAAKTSGSKDYGGELSWLPGQRVSACTCPGEDHPGPNVGVGRGAPEIDVIEGQVDSRGVGSASQSIQVAPMDAGYLWKNTTPSIQIWNDSRTFQNIWQGAVYQESMSVITLGDATSYEDAGYSTYGFEYDPGPNGRITWAMNGTQTWQLNAAAMGPNVDTQIAQRLVSVEPMSINFNLAISTKFQSPIWGQLKFPGHLYIERVHP
ncbi:glycoside hydrolase family 16 protein [Pseudohyphozyma bogoriensis]|nr:glycoside hydrolase family 16 protein [Pseudohyphozyma bogoriensis]